MPDPRKICSVCGEDCAGRPRIKTPSGRYYHKACYDLVRLEQGAREPAPAASGLPDEIDDAGANRLDELLDAPAPSEATAGACHACGQTMAPGDLLCTNCGQSRRGDQVVTAVAKTTARPSVDGRAWIARLGQPAVVLGVYVVVYLLLLLGLRRSPNDATIGLMWLGWHAILVVPLGLAILILAFKEGVGVGILTLCLPFYVIYFVFAICDSMWVRHGFVASIITQVAGVFLLMDTELVPT